jgi:hypothetical protein
MKEKDHLRDPNIDGREKISYLKAVWFEDVDWINLAQNGHSGGLW